MFLRDALRRALTHVPSLPGAVPLLLLSGGLALGPGCGHTSVRLDRAVDELEGPNELYDTTSPDAFVDRLGEPDEWRREGEGDDLRMTAIWNCLKGERRELTWRIAEGSVRRGSWVLIHDRRSDGNCD